jgi:hypothetical protein
MNYIKRRRNGREFDPVVNKTKKVKKTRRAKAKCRNINYVRVVQVFFFPRAKNSFLVGTKGQETLLGIFLTDSQFSLS